MSEMVECVARAMHAASVAEFKDFVAKEGRLDLVNSPQWVFATKPWDEATEISRNSELMKARVAITAMRAYFAGASACQAIIDEALR